MNFDENLHKKIFQNKLQKLFFMLFDKIILNFILRQSSY